VAKRSRPRDFAVYLLVRIVVAIVQALPWRPAVTLADGLAWLAYRLDRRHRLVAFENVRRSFPRLREAALQRRVFATYRHLALMTIEMIRLPRLLHRSNMESYVRYADPADFDRVIGWVKSGRPLMALTGHFGNWEILSYVIGLFGAKAAVVARRLDNPYLDRYLGVFRQKTGMRILDKNRDYDRIQQTLAGGGHLGMVGDQDAGPRGVFVDFFGRPASTFKSIALLSLTYSAPILVMGAARVSVPMGYQIYLEDVILPEHYAGHPDAVRAITERYTAALEQMVRRHPEQYFWLHRRWKHAPPARKSQKAA
jgi:Kdo2-lipid IVA lauroyltransferase/acyltransferase